MNPVEAIKAHSIWKLRIRSLLTGKSGTELDPSVIERDSFCELGRWLHSKSIHSIPREMHRDLLEVHATFHHEAARIVREVQAGRLLGIEEIEPGSAFGDLSSQIVVLLLNLDPDALT